MLSVRILMWLAMLAGGRVQGPGPTSQYAHVLGPVCGDGIVEGDEACDDGNRNRFDACNNRCEPCAPGPANDRDLDGLPDDEDAAPDDPYGHVPWTEAGSQRDPETRVRETINASWDGRIILGSHRPTTNFENTVRVFRPEAVDPDTLPLMAEGRVTSAAVPFEVPDPTTGNLHAGVFMGEVPDEAHGANPYRSDGDGNPVDDGAYETYKFGWIGIMTAPVSGPHGQALMLNAATVVVSAPRTTTAAIHRAWWDGTSTPLTTLSGDHLWRYEPSVSLDGRLVVWNSAGSGATYSFNPTPGVATGWSETRPIAAMYYEHGAGSPSEPMVDGLLFSERYPIAQQPIRDSMGVPFEADEVIPGPYPWLSWDATELIFPAVANFRGAVRSGLVGVGVRTGWRINHLDSAANPDRADLSTDGEIHFTGSPEGGRLESSYRLHTRQDGHALGPRGYDRILMANLYQSDSMWNPFAGDAQPALPWSTYPETFGFFTSTLRHVEVSMPHVVDGHYLLAMPMNERLHFDREKIALGYSGTLSGAAIWPIRRRQVVHLPNKTQDVGPYGHDATLMNGAAFPYEYYDAHQRWVDYDNARVADPSLPDTDEGVWGDRIEGIVGNAIFFPGGSSVRTNLVADAEARLRSASGTTAALWVRPEASLDREALLSVQDHFWTRISDDELLVHYGTRNFLFPLDLQLGTWTHIAITIDTTTSTMTAWVDGEPVGSGQSVANDPQFHIALGPHDSTPTTDALFLIDEFSLSDVLRTHDEIRALALRREEPTPETGNDLNLQGPLANRAVELTEASRTDAAVVDLGETLFNDPQLSRDGTVSCASCHDESIAFTDGLARARGVDGATHHRNTPSLYNRAFSRNQFWDGAVASLEQQALLPISDPVEMDNTLDDALQHIAATYVDEYIDAFGACTITPSTTAVALAAYVRTLESPTTRFDDDALTAQERRGLAVFEGVGRCSSCHPAPTFTDERFHNLGLMPSPELGRAEVTGRTADLNAFKTPTLRGLQHSAPYFHDGRFDTLADVIDFYDDGGDTELGRDPLIRPLALTDQEKLDLEAFLLALSVQQ